MSAAHVSPRCVITADYSPVCGIDGQTYANPSAAACQLVPNMMIYSACFSFIADDYLLSVLYNTATVDVRLSQCTVHDKQLAYLYR